MPRELIDHLKAHGVVIQPSRVEAPLSQRGGFLVAQYDASAVAKIISEFGLQRMALDDPRWVFIAQKTSPTVAAKEVWGVSGRPPQFKLSNGGQFEYFYLLVTPDGEVYLFAEYAFG